MSTDRGRKTPFREQIMYEQLFQEANDAIVLFNIQDEIVDVNESACILFGYTREEFLDLTVSDLIAKGMRINSAERIRNELHRYGSNPFEAVDIKRTVHNFLPK